MKNVLNIDTIAEYNALVQYETFHPLVSIIDFSRTHPKRAREVQSLNFGFFVVFLKDGKHCDIRYGRNSYDYQDGTLVCIAPGQVISIEEDVDDYQPSGYALLFHPDLIRGTSLGHHIADYTFFSYDVREALHVSEQEKQIVLECFRKIDYEVRRAIDKHSKKLIVSNIELFLDYCVRFYDRQFITRDHANTGVLERFERMVNEYFHSGKPQELGIPTVAYFAEQVHLSANYFGDLVRKESGKTAHEYIQLKLIELSKDKMFDQSKSVSQIAFELGFKYPQHFTRLFKNKVGQSPNQYRSK